MPKDYFLSLEGDDSLEFQSDEEEELSMMDTDVDEKSSLLSGHESYNESGTRKVSGERRKAVIYEEALHMCGFGKFHIFLLFMCGWAVSSDAIEVLSVSFLLPAATCDLSLSSDDKGWLNAVVFLGMMVGGYFWGSLADKWGRRNILIWSLLVNGIGNLGSSVSQVFWLFLICRFFSGVGVGGSMPVVFTYYTEFQHKSRRGAMISLLATFWMTGNIVAAGLAWIVIPREYLSFYSGDFIFNSWRVFVALCTLPSLTAGAMFVLMPESPKYLLQKGKEQDAIAVLKQVHSVNKRSKPFQLEFLVLSEEDIEGCSNLKICETGFYQKLKSTSSQLIQSTLRLFGLSLRRTTITLLLINFSLAFGYYGLFLWFPELFNRIDKYGGSFCDSKSGNSTDNNTICQPGNNVYIDSFLTSISNLPGNILSIFIVERVGRKPLLASSMVLSGLSVFFLWFVKERWQSVLMSCLFGAISVVGFNMLDVLQTELFPTEVRSTSFGVQTAALRVGAILGNVIFGLLVDTYCAVPMFLVAGLLAFGGLASLILPKTTGIDIH
ncbi:synaptic vesicle glycoprotein 2C-like isoform X1 [Biomphalaria glabrata]|uniref:Major facilitator superfamily (MFS) profile domain-containing protein n=2 Tax=Biomphalaria glabrata TaxID=6526 RepID=A0A2C9JK48_BIOGL|nr:synaptic vesicle glycoprotein 2C-like isoform X1 [Biomphalaria glabrata]